MYKQNEPAASATRNACKVCAPLGASLVFKGIAGAVPLLHGSQGCSTYIRRYLIGHFREPADIASSSFSEETTIFGGGKNLRTAIDNIVNQYHPSCIGIATTCLAETIGEDVGLHLRAIENPERLPPIVHVNTPSYAGSHVDGFTNTVKAVIDRFAVKSDTAHDLVTLFPGMRSCAELRHLRDICTDFGLRSTLVPDYSDTLDGGIWSDYHLMPPGGTTIEELENTGSSAGSIDFCGSLFIRRSAGISLNVKCGVAPHQMLPPMGIDLTDTFFNALATISGKPIPHRHTAARQRLVDAYIDGHKIAAGRKAAIYGDADQVAALASFLLEIGITITSIITGEPEKAVASSITTLVPGVENATILNDADFEDLTTALADNRPDLLIGSSKGYALSRSTGIPLIRTGFPIQDRIGGQRLMHLGYDGTTILFDTIINTLIEQMQSGSSVGYTTW